MMAKPKQEPEIEQKEEKQAENEERFFVGEIATQTAPMIVDRETNTQYTVELALAKIMNDIVDLKKGIMG